MGGAKEGAVPRTAPKTSSARRVPLRLVAAEQIPQAARIIRGFALMLAAPLPKKLADATFSGALFSKSPSASKVALRSRTQFVPAGHTPYA